MTVRPGIAIPARPVRSFQTLHYGKLIATMRGPLLLFALSVLIGAVGATADAQLDYALPTVEVDPLPAGKSNVLFDPGSVELSTSARKILDYQAATLKQFPASNFEIVGHTDPRETVNRDASFGLGLSSGSCSSRLSRF
jgi:hypothetical protein